MTTAGFVGDTFRIANRFEKTKGEDPPYRVSVLSDEGGLVKSSSGISIGTQILSRYTVADFHALFVAGSEAIVEDQPNDPLLSWIARQGGITSFRVMDNSRIAVVHKEASQSAVPIFYVDGSFGATSTGGMSSTDLTLALIERDLSPDVARKVALELHRHYIENNDSALDDEDIVTTTRKVHEAARWIKENYDKTISVAEAAESASMSKRNFQRRFKCEFGMTPLEYLVHARFEIVQKMLRTTDLPIEKIARRCGIRDGNRLGRVFKERYGMSPTQFRAQQQLDGVEPIGSLQGLHLTPRAL